jgi:hypothetical protein
MTLYDVNEMSIMEYTHSEIQTTAERASTENG